MTNGATSGDAGAILDTALARLAETADEYGGGLSNHGPMAIESLVHLGRSDAVGPWCAAYLPRLDPADAVAPEAPATPAQLVAELAALLPLSIGGATHGLLRTAHALRGIAAFGPSLARSTELGRGLRYWREVGQPFPAVAPSGDLDLIAALTNVAFTPPSSALLISGRLAAVDVEAITPALAAAAPLGSPRDGLAAIGLVALRTLVANPQAFIVFVHAVTSTAMVRHVLDVVGDDVPDVVARQWTTLGALWSAYGRNDPADIPSVGDSPPTWGQLTTHAIANGNEHVIKLVSATCDLAVEADLDYDETCRALVCQAIGAA